jgi:quercetin dioxygenase-like cupin family protein
VELAYVLSGDLRLTVAGEPPVVFHAGDSFRIPRDTPHDGLNVGSTPVRLIVSYLMDKGAPTRIPVPAP